MISNKKEILGNVIFWVMLLSLLYYTLGQRLRFTETPDGLKFYVIYSSFTLLLLIIDIIGKIVFFYVNLFVLTPKYFHKKHYSKYIFYTSLLFIGTLLITLLIEWLLITLSGQEEHVDYNIPFIFLFHVIIVPLSIAYANIKEKFRSEAHSKQLLKEKLTAELNYLKHQINPHFLFNTLNNIFSMTQKHEDKTASNSISQLSRMMRYMLYESNTDRINLEKELKYIKDFVALERLRILKSDTINIDINYDIAKKNCLIAPMLLIPLIENAFKHGISYSKNSVININICWSEEESILVSVKNTNHSNKERIENNSKGIGLKNLKKRLELIYPNNHELKIRSENNFYYTTLFINLKNDH